MNEWIAELADLTAAGERAVVVTVAGIRGSAPREPGAKMLVTASDTYGTIGGGQLEFQCTRIACELLDAPEKPTLRRFPLGSSMGQCCGGVVQVLFEPVATTLPKWLRELQSLHGQRQAAVLVTDLNGDLGKQIVTADDVFADDGRPLPMAVLNSARSHLEQKPVAIEEHYFLFESIVSSDLNIAVFGAGHVGSAVVRALSDIDCNIRWVDNRRGLFRHAPANVRAIETDSPALEVAAMPPGSCYLIMTHSHALDFEICDRALRRGDAAYCGLIGSLSKRRRFEKRFRSQDMPETVMSNLVCPIGVAGISGKKPAEIAVSAAADVLQAFERHRAGLAPRASALVHTLSSV